MNPNPGGGEGGRASLLLAGLEGGGYIFLCVGVAVAAGPLHQVMTPRDFLLPAN